MHALSSSFVLAYHGCDVAVAEKLLAGDSFEFSENDYDWLGNGIYFWEASPQRGLDFAIELTARRDSRVTLPTVVGVAVELGFCLDLTTKAGIDQVRVAYDKFITNCKTKGVPVPINGPHPLLRKLDCAVITTLHGIRGQGNLDPIDTVKGVFLEGKPIYPNSGLLDKTHTQICVRNPDRIKGIFRVSDRFLE